MCTINPRTEEQDIDSTLARVEQFAALTVLQNR
jgi:hypothetical protein